MGKTILIVEDEAVTAMGLKRSLIDMGYSVCGIASTGELALQKAEELRPDLILMDIQLAGEMDGIVAAENIRMKYHTPVIYLTAFSDQRYLDKAKITQPFGYILKPVRESDLCTTIEMALYKHAMEQNLRVSEETTRVLLNETNDMHYLMDTEGKILAANDALAQKAGKSADRLVGSAVYDIVASGSLSPKMACWKMTPLQKTHIQFEEQFRGCWYDVGIYPICNPEGSVIRYAVYIHDISRRKKIEEQLRQNDEFFRSLIEDVSDVIIILNRDGTFRHESPSFRRTVGYTGEQTAGKNFFDMIQKENVDATKRIFKEIISIPYMVKPFRLVLKVHNGVNITLEGIISNLCDNPVIDGIVLNGWIKTSEPKNPR